MRFKHGLCTLFNSVYLDKGLVLYESLEKVSIDLYLYVLAMDDKCYDILTKINKPRLIPIRLSDFETKQLKEAKNNRPFGQYCWTCSSSLIRYILDTYGLDYCTYLDADMCFYSDPYVLVEEMIQRNASVSIAGHRFCKYDKKLAERVGIYCVESNTFKNDNKARMLLDVWIKQCLEDCSAKNDGIHWGDQKYMDNWVCDYDFVIETNHMGAGVAPWNIPQYKLVSLPTDTNQNYTLRRNGKDTSLLFYHFENITYCASNRINIAVFYRWGIDHSLVNELYQPYLKEITRIKRMLKEDYGYSSIITRHPAATHTKQESFWQKVIRHIQMIKNDGLSNLIMHTIPTKLYNKYNFFNINE